MVFPSQPLCSLREKAKNFRVIIINMTSEEFREYLNSGQERMDTLVSGCMPFGSIEVFRACNSYLSSVYNRE